MNLVNGAGGWFRRGKLVSHCLLVESSNGLVLIDTGLGQKDVSERKRRLSAAYRTLFRPQLMLEETALSQVRALGHDPRDVRHVVVTHLDADHAGGLADFPEAKVHVFRPELEHIRNPTKSDRQRFSFAQFEHDPKWVEHEEGGDTWFGFSSIRAIPGVDAEILLIPLVGHSRGHTGVAVKRGDKWLMHCGDAYYHHSQLTDEPKSRPFMDFFEWYVQSIPKARIENQRRLRELAANHRADIDLFCAHDPVEFERCVSNG